MEVKIHAERCKGCGYCVRSCPRGALAFSDKINEQGATCVQLDPEKCIVCGTCYLVCPDLVFEIR